jgi:hypothetical protein
MLVCNQVVATKHCLLICFSICVYTYLSSYLLICWSVCLSIYIYIYVSATIDLVNCLYLCHYACISTCLFILFQVSCHLRTYPYIFLPFSGCACISVSLWLTLSQTLVGCLAGLLCWVGRAGCSGGFILLREEAWLVGHAPCYLVGWMTGCLDSLFTAWPATGPVD